MADLHLVVHDEDYSLVQPEDTIWPLPEGRFASISRLGNEITIACESRLAPEGERQAGFRLLEISGPFALDSVGVVAAVVGPLAAAGIGLFAFSVWSSDAFLIQAQDAEKAIKTLVAAGHTVTVSARSQTGGGSSGIQQGSIS